MAREKYKATRERNLQMQRDKEAAMLADVVRAAVEQERARAEAAAAQLGPVGDLLRAAIRAGGAQAQAQAEAQTLAQLGSPRPRLQQPSSSSSPQWPPPPPLQQQQ